MRAKTASRAKNLTQAGLAMVHQLTGPLPVEPLVLVVVDAVEGLSVGS